MLISAWPLAIQFIFKLFRSLSFHIREEKHLLFVFSLMSLFPLVSLLYATSGFFGQKNLVTLTGKCLLSATSSNNVENFRLHIQQKESTATLNISKDKFYSLLRMNHHIIQSENHNYIDYPCKEEVITATVVSPFEWVIQTKFNSD